MGKFKESSKVKDLFEDFGKYQLEFDCNECGNNGEDNFSYDRTVANGEVWYCKECNKELLITEKPNEDDY